MKKPLVTRNDIAEAIALHTACIPTREIPGAIANYFMITRRFYTRTDKAVINRLLIAEIRDYLIEQGRLRYATVAAEMRKEAHRMTSNNLNVKKPAPVASATPAPAVNVIPTTGDTIDSLTLLKMVNEARKLCGEPEVRNNKFIEKILDELEGEDGYTKKCNRAARWRYAYGCHNHDLQTSPASRRARIESGPPFADRQTGRIAAGKLPYPIDPPNITRSPTPGCRVGRTEIAAGTTAGGRSP
ncbi:KilA protein [Escherichia coli ISC7]|uniref:KilA protein n=1 Tax=Escherichia coli ISC7 TaxID=1432555 RepID=W1F1A3_ECOLX|nr:KilA protein [Escherichia coli ISC7]